MSRVASTGAVVCETDSGVPPAPSVIDCLVDCSPEGVLDAGSVITAVATPGKTPTNAPGTGQVLACWSKRQSDSGAYEVQVVSGTPVELSLLLPALGQQGFVVTAFGAGDQQSYIAVGTRPVGTAMPHIIRVDGPGLPSGPTVYEGFVPIGRMNDLWGSNHYWVFQR